MRRPVLFILVNIIVSIIVVVVVVSVLNQREQPASTPLVVTVPVLITTTPNAAQPQVIIVTATLPAGQVILPTDIIGEIQLSGTRAPLPTLDETLIATTGAGAALAGTQAALPTNCIPHVLQEGEFPSLVAEQYDVSLADLLAVNNLTEETSAFLQIGEVLIVPLEGCELTAESIGATQTATFLPSSTATDAPTTAPSATVSPIPTRTPTATLPATAENARVAIVAVRDPGTVTSELVEIRNNDTGVVDLSGWTLRDANGNEYTFPAERRLFGGGSVTLFSRVGEDTAIALFWDRQQSAFARGDVVTLFDNQDRAQSTFTVP
ncbi:MAG TPA: lamin tail domain-containing protein [Candidatus Limnocylindrales bacterium]|jgi:LysM repeat protein|nr:lamin tail domain-containing protein [Candidatus Limnocylindrales bacterium]